MRPYLSSDLEGDLEGIDPFDRGAGMSDAPAANSPAVSAAGRQESQRAGAEKFIFVVDDYPDLAEVAKTVLEAVGYRVAAFTSRDRALSAFLCAKRKPMLLITDYLGGPMSGIALVKACKAVDPQLKVLLLSGLDSRMLSEREWALVDGVLGKPYYPATLVEKVWRLCGKANSYGLGASSEKQIAV